MVECPPAGCSTMDPPSPMNRELLARAEFDLQCDRTQLHIVDVDSASSIVEGCARQARYVWGPDDGDWRLDSPVLSSR